MKVLVQPKVLLPAALSLALIGALLGIADVPKVADLVRRISPSLVGVTFPLVVLYLALKSLQLRFFLRDIRILVPWRPMLLAFATGEMCTSVPGGAFLQNYVLGRVAGAGFARSSAATAGVLATEGGVSLLLVAILGVPGWSWLRPAILTLFGVAAAALCLLIGVGTIRDVLGRLVQAGPLRPVGRGFMDMVEGLRRLLTPRVVVRAGIMGTAYLLVMPVGLLVIAHGVGEPDFTYRQAVTVFAFALAMVLVSPISSQIGVMEVGGVGAMHAMGYDATRALAILLGLRLVWTASTWVACGLILLLLRREWQRPITRPPAAETSPPSRRWYGMT